MGDYFERIVDVEVTGEEAGSLAERMVGWMVAEGLITREMSGDGVFSLQVDAGYEAGPNWERAVADSSDPSWVPGPVAVIVGRDHHVGGQGMAEADSATCPRCDTKTVIIDYPEEFEADQKVWQPFSDGIDTWKETGAGSVSCSSCGASVPVTEWQFGSGFALGALAFDFWGWPPLSVSFQAELSRQLGHRIEAQMGEF
ncbi:hypothetical protein Misp01_44760 [Microtetraspora sp. NBRC 13810]|uniref:hypothetical protein n=1 Tax=Microtetraspora sp. NBRC 13810 TaxID=3030990 RepID=UPI0024A3E06C|nr:hypothetical protein [Microtetraspora sp. NBRC 13810]GLW09347.1 hypothetical protein Misp01_44760 [Microtetraspora sp. NBRC 13810]